MKKGIIVSLLCIYSVCASAQTDVETLTFMPKVGINLADFTNEPNTDPRFGWVAGAEFGYQVAKRLNVSLGFLYSEQGTIDHVKYRGMDVKEEIKNNYINMPLVASVYFIKGLALKLGVQLGVNVKSDFEVSALGIGVTGHLNDLGVKINTLDLSFPIGLSYELKNFMIDARYNYGATKICDDNDYRNSVFQFTVGYKIVL